MNRTMSSLPETPIPMLVNISIDDDENSPSHTAKAARTLEFGSSTRGTMAKARAFSSPLAFFTSPDAKGFHGGFDNASVGVDDGEESRATSQSLRLGIERPSYNDRHINSNAEDEATQASLASHRLGIQRPDYRNADDEDIVIPQNTPPNLYFQHRQMQGSQTTKPLDTDTGIATSHNKDRKLGCMQIYPTSWSVGAVPHGSGRGTSIDKRTEKDDDQDDGVDRLLHKQTADGKFLVNSPALDSPMKGMRYSLGESDNAMTPEMKQAAKKSKVKPKIKPKSPLLGNPEDPTSPENLEASFKVFLLLILPKSKIFELIQVIYSPSRTTVGDLLAMIATNATEPALGSQSYSGLCRPKDGVEIDVKSMASASGEGTKCARITRGEILVAIPEGYSAELCREISKPILDNPQIERLMRRADPLAPRRKSKKRKKSKKRRSSSSRKSSSSTNSTGISTSREDISTVHEENSTLSGGNSSFQDDSSATSRRSKNTLSSVPEDDVELERAIKHAAEKAAASNASLDDSRNASHESDANSVADSFASAAMAGSYMSIKSKYSLETTTATGKRIPRRKAKSKNRKSRRQQRLFVMMRLTAFVSCFLIGRYCMDEKSLSHYENQVNQPMGFLGFIQFISCFLAVHQLHHKYEKRNKIIISDVSPVKSTSASAQ